MQMKSSDAFQELILMAMNGIRTNTRTNAMRSVAAVQEEVAQLISPCSATVTSSFGVAISITNASGHQHLNMVHLCMGIFEAHNSVFQKVLGTLGIDIDELRGSLRNQLRSTFIKDRYQEGTHIQCDTKLLELITYAKNVILTSPADVLNTGHFMHSLLEFDLTGNVVFDKLNPYRQEILLLLQQPEFEEL